MNSHIKNRKGFTIIEVVLVLAIAALIMLMVFIALPALQRNQRDTQRKDDISRLQTAITQYKTNNKGKAPFTTATNATNFITNYLRIDSEVFADPNGTNYSFVARTTAAAGSGQVGVQPRGKCSNANENPANSSYVGDARTGALRLKLESGGFHCIEY